MASYSVNKAAVAHARDLIEKKQYVLDSDWGEVQPAPTAQNAYLERHSWEEYAAWHLGLTEGANDETKARYAFVCGDFRRVHRTGADRLRLPGRRSGGTRRSSWPPTTCSSTSTDRRHQETGCPSTSCILTSRDRLTARPETRGRLTSRRLTGRRQDG